MSNLSLRCMGVLLVTIPAGSSLAVAQPIHSTPAIRPAGPATRPYLHQPGSFYRYGVPSTFAPRYPSYPVSPVPPSNDLPPLAKTPSSSAIIHVLAVPGATVTFDGKNGETADQRHTYTTEPISHGAETRVRVTVAGPSGSANLTIRVRGGDRATVDLR